MKLAFCYHPFGMRVPIDIDTIWTSTRGLTGSEMGFFMLAFGMAEAGHDVSIYSKFTKPGSIRGARCFHYEDWDAGSARLEWDAVLASTMADPLMNANPKSFRFLHHQCKGFGGSPSGWEQHVDMLAPLSSSHAKELAPETTLSREKWRVLHNGVDTVKFSPGKKVPGKMIWASSLDRGCHWLLEAFPVIRAAVPEANLHIFYDFHSIRHMAETYTPTPANPYLTDVNFELGSRSRYILEALHRLEGKGVFPHGSVSRERVENEMRESSILAYPLDPVYYTETFGVTVLEACACGTVPVLCAADAFGELWGPCAETVPAPYPLHKDEWIGKVIHCLRDEKYRSDVAQRCVDHSKKFEWSILAKNLARCLETRGVEGLPQVDWAST